MDTSTNQNALKDQLKKRLFDDIAAQIDLIAIVPEDIDKLLGDFRFDAEALAEPMYDDEVAGWAEQGLDQPVLKNAGAESKLATQVNNHYDRVFYSKDPVTGMLLGDTEYRNLGYWDDTTTDANLASERLQDALLGFIPEKTGRMLDVACGMGASTRRLLNHYPAENVWAINISDKQIESTRKNAPGCHAAVMNAVEMTFEGNFFDNIICIEAAFHFDTRRKFLQDALRILKPGGRLVLSDILVTSAGRLAQYSIFPGPANHLETVEEYRALLSETGFTDIVVQDVSREVWGGHFRHIVARIHQAFYEGRLNIVQLTEILWTYYQVNAVTGKCLFVSARKP